MYKTRIARPLPESGIRQFGQWIVSEDWDSISNSVSSTEQVLKFQEMVSNQLDKHFPTKSVRTTQQDKPFITFELKKLDKIKKREYRRHGKSEKYLRLLEKFDHLDKM